MKLVVPLAQEEEPPTGNRGFQDSILSQKRDDLYFQPLGSESFSTFSSAAAFQYFSRKKGAIIPLLTEWYILMVL